MRVVLLGTGTGIGKTTTACFLARAASQCGVPTAALKPIETGYARTESGHPALGSDAAQLEAASLHVQHPRPHPLFAFEQPLSPHLAAELSGQGISLPAVEQWVTSVEKAMGAGQATLTLIETAGGALSPLTVELTNADLCRELKADLLVLVAEDRLGALHHVRAASGAMASVWRQPDCVVLTPPVQADQSTTTNARELRRLNEALTVFETTGSNGECPELLKFVLQRCRSAGV